MGAEKMRGMDKVNVEIVEINNKKVMLAHAK